MDQDNESVIESRRLFSLALFGVLKLLQQFIAFAFAV
jgi:hypothetical protein